MRIARMVSCLLVMFVGFACRSAIPRPAAEDGAVTAAVSPMVQTAPAPEDAAILLRVHLLQPNYDQRKPCFMDHQVKPYDEVFYVAAPIGTDPGAVVLRLGYKDARNRPRSRVIIRSDMMPPGSDSRLTLAIVRANGGGHAFFGLDIMPGAHVIEPRGVGQPAHEWDCPMPASGEIGLWCYVEYAACGFQEGGWHNLISVRNPAR